MAEFSLSRSIAEWIDAQPGNQATKDQIAAAFSRFCRQQVMTAVGTATRNGWIAQDVRTKPAGPYRRTTVSLKKHYRSPRISAAVCDGCGMGDLTRAETIWQATLSPNAYRL